jgi:hypothetical protein
MGDSHLVSQIPHGWKDFFVQIAAIAIGLLLALGLDRVVGYFHNQQQLTEARRELRLELGENRDVWNRNSAEVQRIEKELKTDLEVIQELQSHSTTTAKLDYSVGFYAVKDGPWQAVRQNGSLNLMPNDELQDYTWFHGILSYTMEAMHAFEPVMTTSAAIASRAPLEKLTDRDLDELASKTSEAQGRLAHLSMFLGYERNGLDRMSRSENTVSPSPNPAL